MAGDDYLTDKEHIAMKGGKYDPNDDWSICLDRSRHEGAVKGAVRRKYVVCLEDYISILLLSYTISSGALENPCLFLSHPTIKIASSIKSF